MRSTRCHGFDPSEPKWVILSRRAKSWECLAAAFESCGWSSIGFSPFDFLYLFTMSRAAMISIRGALPVGTTFGALGAAAFRSNLAVLTGSALCMVLTMIGFAGAATFAAAVLAAIAGAGFAIYLPAIFAGAGFAAGLLTIFAGAGFAGAFITGAVEAAALLEVLSLAALSSAAFFNRACLRALRSLRRPLRTLVETLPVDDVPYPKPSGRDDFEQPASDTAITRQKHGNAIRNILIPF
ncbi:hypothetical protein MnTg02_00878 [bacterium MnTg02]|nr:hypothetical protein MnTg02_00878 [bacterium MnTg02]